MTELFIIVLAIVSVFVQVNAECCFDLRVYRICWDGSNLNGYYCGYGPCNIFGCNCEGGCRTNSKKTVGEAMRLSRIFTISQKFFHSMADSSEILRT